MRTEALGTHFCSDMNFPHLEYYYKIMIVRNVYQMKYATLYACNCPRAIECILYYNFVVMQTLNRRRFEALEVTRGPQYLHTTKTMQYNDTFRGGGVCRSGEVLLSIASHPTPNEIEKKHPRIQLFCSQMGIENR